MGCQHAIADQIIAKGGAYIFALKGNQGILHDDVRAYFGDEDLYKDLMPFESWDKGHGRIESRRCWVVQAVNWLHEQHSQWKTIKSLIRIDAMRERKGKVENINIIRLANI